MHDRMALPSRITVHAPHWPSPQPNRGPFRLQVVAQDVQQRRGSVGINHPHPAIYLQRDLRHGVLLISAGHARGTYLRPTLIVSAILYYCIFKRGPTSKVYADNMAA